MDVRHGESESILATNLIVHHGIANIFNQATQFIRVLDVVEEALNLPLLCQWLKLSSNAFQFPNNPRLSDSVLYTGE